MKSLYLNWIGKKDKSLLLPDVVFVKPTEIYSGYYCFPERKEIIIGNRYYPLNRGLIVTTDDDEEIANVLAHEWRHHWQRYNQKYPESYPSFNIQMPYEKAIRKFFQSCPLEMDALLFSHKYAPSELSEYWVGLLGGFSHVRL